jgi:hypothetical protein
MNPKRIGAYEVKIRITFAVILFIFCTAFILAFAFLPTQRDLLVFSAVVIGGASAIYSAYFAAQTLRINLQRDKLKRALEITNRVSGIELSKVRALVHDEIISQDMSETQVIEIIKNDREIKSAVITVLNNLEDVAISIQKGDSDEETVYMNLAYLLPKIYSTIDPYIQDMRKSFGSLGLYTELERLSKCWESGKYLFDGSPVLRFDGKNS